VTRAKAVAKRKPIPARGERAKKKILDAAEALFAKKGFYGVTIREITRKAGVDTAMANYYFGPKRALFDAVMMRRAEDLNAARLARLEAVEREAGEGPPVLERVIDAFTHPLLDRSALGGAGWKSYFVLIAMVNNSPEWGGRLMTEYFDPIVRRFLVAIKKALPDAPPEEIYWSYHFLSGALTLTFAETGRIDNLSDGLCKSHDLESIQDRLPAFIAAGFEALRERRLVLEGAVKRAPSKPRVRRRGRLAAP
jgi:AcrR family transcriptional regulator